VPLDGIVESRLAQQPRAVVERVVDALFAPDGQQRFAVTGDGVVEGAALGDPALVGGTCHREDEIGTFHAGGLHKIASRSERLYGWSGLA
jgi:hypothetical protein